MDRRQLVPRAPAGDQPEQFKPMRPNPLKQGALTMDAHGIGTVTLQMVRWRARELAVINGHSSPDPTESDLAQAARELTGQSDIDPETEVLEAAPESERWDPVPGSTGHKVPTTASEDEDDEGRSDEQLLVEEGIEAAEHDQMLQASKEAAKNP